MTFGLDLREFLDVDLHEGDEAKQQTMSSQFLGNFHRIWSLKLLGGQASFDAVVVAFRFLE